MGYVGRFAPSPTGPLHAGSLYTALASYLDARAHTGVWQLRIDDIDAPRAMPGAADLIQEGLEAHGLGWDGPAVFQSRSVDRYLAALERLRDLGKVFYCRCSRASLPADAPYPGTCRSNLAALDDAAQRLRCDDRVIVFEDRLQGMVVTDLGLTCGDFVVWRRDGLPAYQLATACDDGDSAINQVVRGNDLQAVTARQIHIMELLDFNVPQYAHLPVVVDAAGTKLSKRTGAEALDNNRAGENLTHAMQQLKLSPPDDLKRWPVPEMLAWAQDQWALRPDHLAHLRGLQSVVQVRQP